MDASHVFATRCVCLILAAISTSTLAAQHATQNARERDVEREKTAVAHLEDEWLSALNRADVKTIGRVLADDFLRPSPDSDQFVDKTDLLQFYRSHLSPQVSGQKRIEGMTVTLYGSTALARGTLTTTDQEGRVIRKLLFTDVFVKRAGKWFAVSAQENLVTLGQVPNR